MDIMELLIERYLQKMWRTGWSWTWPGWGIPRKETAPRDTAHKGKSVFPFDCFGCEKGEDIFSMVMLAKELGFKEVIRKK